MKVLALLLLTFCTGLDTAGTADTALALTPGVPSSGLAAYMQYRLSDGLPLDAFAEIAALPDDAFEPLPEGQINFGFMDRTIWVRLDVVNTADTAGRWRISTDALYAFEMGIWQERGGEIVPLLESARDSTFFERPLADRFLAAELRLAPGGRSRILIGLRRTGATSMRVAIDTDESFAARRFRTDTANAAVYAAIAFAALLAIVQLAVLRDRTHLAYLGYVASVTLYLLHVDGLAFQYLWPGFGRWNEVAGLPIGMLNGIAAANFARTFLRTRAALPRMDRLLAAIMIVSAAVAVAGVFVSEAFFKQSAIWISMATTLLCITAGVLACRRGQKSVRFYLVAWAGVALATVAWGVVNAAHSELDFALGQYFTKAGLLFDMLMFLLAMADQALEVRAERDRSVASELEVARRRQELEEQLRAAEEARLRALLLAQRRTQQLADASHDLRQPLVSLKLNVASLMNRPGPGGAMLRAFAAEVEALEALIRDALAETKAPAAPGRLP